MKKFISLSIGVLFCLLFLTDNSIAQKSGSPNTAQPTKPAKVNQEEVKPLSVGDIAPDFQLLNVDGATVSLAEKANRGAIIVFTSNHCPFSQVYERRIIELHNNFAEKGFPVIAINPNDSVVEPEDSYTVMQKLASGRNYSFPYLLDAGQSTAKAYGATKTPHVFVLQNENGTMIVKYIGSIDDNADDISAVTQHYVANAVTELLEGREVSVANTKAVGCSIKWKK
jgi:peroxiredoxin